MKAPTATLPRVAEMLCSPPLGAGSWRYRVAYGGRGAVKSWSFARALLLAGLARPIRVLCAREYQASIRDSVHALLTRQITLLGLTAHYQIQETAITARHGTEILYAGLRRNPHSLKSLEGLDLVWIEEAEMLSEESMTILFPTVRKPGSEIWISFNTRLASDPVYQRFVLHPPPTACVRQWHYTDNPWFAQTALPEQLAEDRRRDPVLAAHVWDGEPWSRAEVLVLGSRWRVEALDPTGWDGPYYGVDWGFARDPTVGVRCWRSPDSRTLYLDAEVGGDHLNVDQTAAVLGSLPGAGQHVLSCDAARPEMIAEMQRRHLACQAAPKWPGSVEDGVTHLLTYHAIVVHPSCRRAREEAALWRYATNQAGQVLPQLEDGNDHVWDAVRYALHGLVRPALRMVPRLGS